jgi:hypothetical protein
MILYRYKLISSIAIRSSEIGVENGFRLRASMRAPCGSHWDKHPSCQRVTYSDFEKSKARTLVYWQSLFGKLLDIRLRCSHGGL